jgi:hypothetical protein
MKIDEDRSSRNKLGSSMVNLHIDIEFFEKVQYKLGCLIYE